MKKYFNKNYLMGFPGLIVLLIGLFWFYSTRSLASDTKNCEDIPIFKRHIQLSACQLEQQIDDKLKSVSDVRIKSFRYRPLSHTKSRRVGLLRISAIINSSGVKTNLRCEYVNIKKADDTTLNNNPTVQLYINKCKNRNWKTGYMFFYYPLDIITKEWDKQRQKLD